MKPAAFFKPEEDSFKKFVTLSLVLHAAFFLGFTVKNLVFSNEEIIIPDAIRVDMVALPDKPTDAPAPPPKPTPQKKTETPPEKPKVDKKEFVKEAAKDFKDSEKKALEKLNQKSAIDKIMKEVNSDQEKAEKEAKPQLPKGNVLTSGNSLTGLSKLRVNEYFDKLKTKVHDHWVLPQFLSNANLKASVLMAIDAHGNISRKEMQTSSGNSIFDSSCLAAVADAAPFDPPPEEFHDNLIVIRFPFE